MLEVGSLIGARIKRMLLVGCLSVIMGQCPGCACADHGGLAYTCPRRITACRKYETESSGL